MDWVFIVGMAPGSGGFAVLVFLAKTSRRTDNIDYSQTQYTHRYFVLPRINL
jgi:hypothetical protein